MKPRGKEMRALRMLIREEVRKYYFGGSYPEERYEVELLDDPDFEAPSVYVPDDVKEKIKTWAVAMGLSTSGKKTCRTR